MTSEQDTILAWLKQQNDLWINQLVSWSNINSGSHHLAGLKQMHDILFDAFSSVSDKIESITTPNGSTILFCQKRPHLARRVLLSGHMDTVYSPHDSFQKVNDVTHQKMIGPGVADMKGGLIVMLAALLAFEKTTAAQSMGWDVFINADEELGSTDSMETLLSLAKSAQAALVFEPTLTENGTFARARAGCGHFTITATGKKAHAGRDFFKGKNAIMLLAKALSRIDALNHPEQPFTINAGLIEGGDTLNQVPDYAKTKLDIRLLQPEAESFVIQQLYDICEELSEEDASLELRGKFHRPVKTITPATQHLFDKTQSLAAKINLKRTWQDAGGCCDGNNLAATGLAVIDTLGVRGGSIHTPQEYICLDSIVEQASLTFLLLNELAEGFLEGLYE